MSASGGAAGEAEGPGLKGAAAGVPEVVCVRQGQGVELARRGDILVGAENQRAQEVAIVHHVEKREARIETGRGEKLKERAVRVVVGIVVARSIRVTPADPRLQLGEDLRLESAFEIERIRTLVEAAPPSGLRDAPCEEIESAGGGREGAQVVTAESADADIVQVAATGRQRAVVGLHDATPVVVVDRESAGL